MASTASAGRVGPGRRLGRDIALVLGLKLVALVLLWALCFGPGTRHAPDVGQAIFGVGTGR